MNCRDRDLVETTIFRVVETEICRDWPKIVEIEIFPRLSLISVIYKVLDIEPQYLTLKGNSGGALFSRIYLAIDK